MRGGFTMNDIKELKIIILTISGLGFIFFTINQFLNQLLLIALLELADQDTTMIQLNYVVMLVIGGFLLLTAFTEFISKD